LVDCGRFLSAPRFVKEKLMDIPKILIVDDEPFNVDYLEQLLEELGYQTVSANNGQDALTQVAVECPDVILLDIMMPLMDGFQVLERLKSNEAWRGIPVVIISAMNDLASVVRGIVLGADDYLPKPFNEILLKARLEASLEKKRWRDQELTYLAEIERERKKAEDLLLNILPDTIAQRLKRGESPIADIFMDVTVMFADIVGFTHLTERIAPEKMVSILNKVFSAFDNMAHHYGLEKIKTIGDAYMVVGGLPTPRPDHAQAVAEMALEMQQLANLFSMDDGTGLTLRIGINTGPAVAAVIGNKKFSYDLWGDTVNTASRMESHGIPGRIQLTEATYQHLNQDYVLEKRGAIEVKGKGKLVTYFLEGRKDTFANC
jgi:class 3 adenylate cyclase/CheY-like chemotaxis protein